MSGSDLAARVRTIRPDLAQASFLAKPFTPIELLRRVHIVLGVRRPLPSDELQG